MGTPEHRARLLKELAGEAGFRFAGICRPDPSTHGTFLDRWLDQGRHGEMAYLARPEAVARRRDIRRTLPDVRSVLVVAHDYGGIDPPGVPEDPSRGVIARYARGRDYHRVVGKRLLWTARRFEKVIGAEIPFRAYVDTGPLLERELGERAGLGWFGRNTMLIHPRRGSYFFLGALLLGIELEPDPPFERDHCGSCRACLDACPTGALLGRDEDGAPVMDARLCISYLTIENRGPIPRRLRPLIGNRIYGCDICQEVCPFNARFGAASEEPAYAARGPGERPPGVEGLPDPGERPAGVTGLAGRDEDVSAETRGRADGSLGTSDHPGTNAPALTELLAMALSETAWESFSRGSAIRRAGRAGFARNVCVALGNWLADADVSDETAVAWLARALADPEPLVRGHAAWALGRIGCDGAAARLADAQQSEEDDFVRVELDAALSELRST